MPIYIDAIAKAEAHVSSFKRISRVQKAPQGEPWRVKFSRQDATRSDYWRRMECFEEQWHGLCAHATDPKMKFINPPCSLLAAELLQRVGLDAWKVASGEITNRRMLEFMADSGLPPEFQDPTLQTLCHKIPFLPDQFCRVGNRPRLALPASGQGEAAWLHALQQIKDSHCESGMFTPDSG